MTERFGSESLARASSVTDQMAPGRACISLADLVDVALAWVFLTGFSTGGMAIFGLLLVTGMMGYYNYDATDYIERRLL